jgi:4'-phosphopantetheinyl transferase
MADSLDTAQVDVWYYGWDADPAPELIALLYESLSREEREQHGRFYFDRDRHAYLLAHGLLRCALSRCSGVPPAAWEFERDSRGKPFLASPNCGLSFSLSHTAGMVACAIGMQSEIGVDVERVDRLFDFVALAERFFAPGEVQLLESAPPTLRNERFFTLWTLKEAYLKARGFGLRLPLDSFEVRPEDGGAAALAFPAAAEEPPLDWHLRTFSPAASHILSAAVHMTGTPRFVLRDGAELLCFSRGS